MSQKLESNLRNMILSLLFISVGMSAALGFVYTLTKGPIEVATKQKEISAVKEVLPPFDNDPTLDVKTIDGLSFYTGTLDGQIVGVAVKTFTEKGFSGRFDMMVGFKPDGSINNIVIVEQKETPGLGTKMKEPKFKDQFNGKNPGSFKMKVKKDGGEVDAITAATISSRAFCDGVQKAYDLFMKNFANTNPAVTDSTENKGGTQ
jgi:electron transport complex protein RnfG